MANLSKVGKYEVQDLVGEGAMGVVYRALDPMLNRSVAVKVMNDALALDEDFRTRFLREARAAGSLQHPNVITVYDCGEVDGHLYIAMEYVAGTDLEHLMSSKVPLTLQSKIEIIIGVLNGLAYAHKRGIVHRDVKPANIRVNEEGRALIMDFGIAHTASSNMTKTGLMIGTPNYMAPEQVVGGPITAQTDIFAAGVVLYELLTNTRPFEGANLHSVLYKIVSEAPPPPEKVVTGLRPDLAEIVMKALAKDAAERYASALDMANALSRVNTSISIGGTHSASRTLSLRSSIELALHDDAAEKAKEQAKADGKRKVMLGVGAGVVVMLAIGGALYSRRAPGATPAVPAPATQTAANPAATVPSTTSPAAGGTAAPVTPPAAPAAVASAPSAAQRPTAAPAAPAGAKPGAASGATDMSLALTLQSTALQSRRRAVEAGANATQLAVGDQHNASGEQFVKKGQRDDAAREFNQASSAWSDAESAARASSAAAASAAATREQPRSAPVVVAPAPTPVQTPPTQPAGNPSADITALVAQYARAIDARDVGEMKRLYPGMSAAQASNFEAFFKGVKSLHATFSATGIQVDGASAEAKMDGAYDFVTPNGRNEHQPQSLQAVLRKEGGGWRFISIK